MQEWRVYSKKADFKAIADRLGVDQVVARIIRNRGIEKIEDFDKYIHGGLESMYDSSLMKDMDKAVNIILDSINNKRKIRIIGDYDIDGICSIYILFKGLLFLGADIDYEVPDRIADGYGINEKLIKEAHEAGKEVIITCDNGIAAIDQIKYAKSLGMTVVVTDHHDIRYEETETGRKYILPEADAVVDCKQTDCQYPDKNLCGAGVAYKFIELAYRKSNIPKEKVYEFLEFAGLATIGDVVDLQDENRIFVKEGLKRIRKTTNHGLNALMILQRVDKTQLSAYHIGFVIGPCLNASGRLDTAKRALEMLLTDDKGKAERLAGDLKALNDERKDLTLKATEDAIYQIDNSDMKNDSVLVVFLPECHESIAGIVAGRIREKYYKPAIVLTRGEEFVKGSARSIENYNIFEKLMECKELLAKFGGHPMAAGLSLEEKNVDTLRKMLNEKANLSENDLIEKIWIDVPMPIDYISEKLINDLNYLEPFGKGNEKPVFADKNLEIVDYIPLKDGQYSRLKLMNTAGNVVEAMAFFNSPELEEAFLTGKHISCTYYPQINEFRGNKKLQICISGYKIENKS